MSLAVGVELSRSRVAACVVEGDHREDGAHFQVRYLERLPQGLSFPLVAERLAELLAKVRRRHNGFPVYINETEVGAPVVDLIQPSIGGAVARRVHFNFGQQQPAFSGSTLVLGKAWLVSRLQVLLQTSRLHLPRSRDAKLLAEDLTNFSGPDATGPADSIGSFRIGTQDDLINALGLAVHADLPRPSSGRPHVRRRPHPLSALYGDRPPGAIGRL